MTFWQDKKLNEMTREEWESLCDGCGKCCLHKLEDDDTGTVYYTDVACRMLDLETISCRRYSDRKRYVANCVVLRPAAVKAATLVKTGHMQTAGEATANFDDTLRWMPPSCAYRLLAEGKALPDWHPLVSGDRNSVHTAGMSVKGRVVDERLAGDFEDHLVEWPQKKAL